MNQLIASVTVLACLVLPLAAEELTPIEADLAHGIGKRLAEGSDFGVCQASTEVRDGGCRASGRPEGTTCASPGQVAARRRRPGCAASKTFSQPRWGGTRVISHVQPFVPPFQGLMGPLAIA